MIQGNGAARELFTEGDRYTFAVLSTSDQYLEPAIALAAEHAGKLGKSKEQIKVALAVGNDPFRKTCAPVSWTKWSATAWWW